MGAPASLIADLEDVIRQGTPERRAQMLERVTRLFLDGASRFNEDHVGVFDNVLSRLAAEIEAQARAELSRRLAPVNNAPMQVVRALAKDDDIAVAGPEGTRVEKNRFLGNRQDVRFRSAQYALVMLRDALLKDV